MKGREFLQLALGTVATLRPRSRTEGGVKEIHIEYQKNRGPIIAREPTLLEEHLLGLILRQSGGNIV